MQNATLCVSAGMAPLIQDAVSTGAIAQIQTDGQILLGKIPALLRPRGANLLHCRSPLSLVLLEHVDNLGAYSIPSETGLLIPSVHAKYLEIVSHFGE